MKRFNHTTLLCLSALCLAALLAACGQTPTQQETLVIQDFGTASQEFAQDVAANSTGVYTVGYTDGSLDGPNKGGTDAFLRKYNGGKIWGRQFGSSSFDAAYDIAVDSTGNNYTLGDTNGALGLKIGSYDSFLRKYDTNGVLKWTRQFGTAGLDASKDVVVTAGNIYTLSYEGSKAIIRKWNSSGSLLLTIATPIFTGDPKALALDTTGNLYMVAAVFNGANYDVKLYKYSSAGVTVAGFPKNIYATANNDYPYDMKIASNTIYVTFLSDDGAGVTVSYIRKLMTSGVPVWTRVVSPSAVPGFTAPNALAVDSSGNIYIGGNTAGAYAGYTNAGFFDIFALKYNSSGTRLWVRQFGATDDELNFGIAVSNAVYLVGGSYSSPNLLGDPGQGSADAYLAQLNSTTGAVVAIDQ
jgi:hypothetical protein